MGINMNKASEGESDLVLCCKRVLCCMQDKTSSIKFNGRQQKILTFPTNSFNSADKSRFF